MATKVKAKKTAALSADQKAVVYRWLKTDRPIIHQVFEVLKDKPKFTTADVVKALASWKDHPASRTPQNVIYHYKRFGLIAEVK